MPCGDKDGENNGDKESYQPVVCSRPEDWLKLQQIMQQLKDLSAYIVASKGDKA